MRHLVLIEAPGKKEKITKIIKDNNILTDFEVVATSGQIYDLPKKEIGIDYDTLEEHKVLRKDYVAKRIVDKVKQSQNIYLMMDNDDVGEQICRDIIDLTGIDGYYRIRFNDLSQRTIKKAFENKKRNLDENMIIASDARRLINRTIGYNVVDRSTGVGMKAPVGTVATPIISELSNRDVECGTLTMYSHNDNIPLKLKLGLTSRAFNYQDEIRRILVSALYSSDNKPITERDVDFSVDQLNYHDALLLTKRLTGNSIEKTEKNIQSIYEKGKISYARTGSRKLPSEVSKEREELWRKFNNLETHELLEEDVDKLDVMAQESKRDPHPCIYPTDSDIHLNDDITSMDDETATLNIISDMHLFASQKGLVGRELERRLIIKKREIEELRRLGVIIKKHEEEMLMRARLYKRKESMFEKVLDRDIEPMRLLTKKEYRNASSKVEVFQRKNKIDIILDIMDKKKIGKPSTIGYHSSRISAFFDDDLKPNGLARAGFSIARDNIPLLLDSNNAIILENIINDETKTLSERVHDGLMLFGVDINDFKKDAPVLRPDENNSPKTGFSFDI